MIVVTRDMIWGFAWETFFVPRHLSPLFVFKGLQHGEHVYVTTIETRIFNMTMQVKDVPDLEAQDTLAVRLRTARDDKGYSRKELAEITGIPMKTLEKYEAGTSEPPLSRVETLSKHLGIPLSKLAGVEAEAEAEAEEPLYQIDAETGEGYRVYSTQLEDDDTIDQKDSHALALLKELDQMRIDGFDRTPRKTKSILEDVSDALKELEPSELIALAEQRNLYIDDCLDLEKIVEQFASGFESGQQYCGLVEERIIDTAVFGVDLFSIERSALIVIANELANHDESIEPTRYAGFSWGEHEDFIPIIRPHIRVLAFAKAPSETIPWADQPQRSEPLEE